LYYWVNNNLSHAKSRVPRTYEFQPSVKSEANERQDFLYTHTLIGPGFPLAGGLCKFTPTPGITTNTAPTTLSTVQYKQQQQANLLLSMNTPLVNDKNKQLTIYSQRKLALTTINKLYPL
jgi:hypothetical protein